MKKFIGTKQVSAEPMTYGEAHTKGLIRENAYVAGNDDKPGYFVEYADGYQSWSPANVFEEAYKVAETPLDRVNIEVTDLMERANKLGNFIYNQNDGKDFQALTSQDFYLYLRFETNIPLKNANDEFASGEYFYNPHFAETVKPFVPAEDGAPFIDWDGDWKDSYQDNQPPYAPEKAAEAVKTYITQALTPGTAPVSVSVRTPRHFFHLSKYEDYYSNARLSFQQGLRLDGNKDIYTGYRDIEGYSLLRYDERDFQLQTPIGTQASPFLGSYNGNSLAIRRVAFEIPKNDKNRVCAGLFGSSGGTLENIVYSLDPSDTEQPEGEETLHKPRSIIFYSSEKDTYLGALAGLNTLTGKIVNCAVDSVNLTTQIYTTRIYIGGLCGMNAGLVQNSAAESAYLHVDASNYGSAYAGGLAGSNSGQISTSYAVANTQTQSSFPEEGQPVIL